MIILVGNTGFVGSNLCNSFKFDAVYNSKNIKNAFGTSPDILVYAGVRGTKFLANENPFDDLVNVFTAINNIIKIRPKKIVLISSVDVYDNINNVDESTEINPNKLHTYGRHRFFLEEWIKSIEIPYLIVRLPAIYGENLRKNFVYDLIHEVPPLLSQEIVKEISESYPQIRECYSINFGNYLKVGEERKDEKEIMGILRNYNINSKNYTDSRAVYQFYNLTHLWRDIGIALNNGISVLNLVSTPVSASELVTFIDDIQFQNYISEQPIFYNVKTKYFNLYNGENGYIQSKEKELEELRKFILMKRAEK